MTLYANSGAAGADRLDLNLTVRVGCRLMYQCAMPTPALFVIKPWTAPNQVILDEKMVFGPGLPVEQHRDGHGNAVFRVTLTPGLNEVRHDAMVCVPNVTDNAGLPDEPVPVERLGLDLLRYTLPSRYCDSDKIMNFAWQRFSGFANGAQRVQAICDWAHENIEYRYGSGDPTLSAWDIITRGHGVCRDLAHVTVALCRAFNLPARYVSGHLPDIGVVDPGIAMDFHAYAEIYLGGHWHSYDARNNVPRIGRIRIAQGMDAIDGAFATFYGAAEPVGFEVWAYQVDPGEVRVGDPVDLSKRLDGTPRVRFAA